MFNMRTVFGIVLFILPTLSHANWSSYICEITRENEVVALAYLNVDRPPHSSDGTGTLQVWSKGEVSSFRDEIVVKGKHLKHTYFKGTRYSGVFHGGFGRFIPTGNIYDQENPTDSEVYIRCENIEPKFDIQ